MEVAKEEYKPDLPKTIHPHVKDDLSNHWRKVVRGCLDANALPRILLSVRPETGTLGKKMSLLVTHPGLTTEQAYELLRVSTEVMRQKALREKREKGPELILPP